MRLKTNRMHLLVKRQCFVQVEKESAACRVWRPKDVKASESETVDGQNIQTLQHALC